MKIERLNGSHDRKSFSCGNDSLDAFIHNYALKKSSIGNIDVRVAVYNSNPGEIIGYYSDIPHSIKYPDTRIDGIPKSKTGNNIYGRLLTKLAVDSKYQKQGIGEALIYHMFTCFNKANEISSQGSAIFVRPLSEQLHSYYNDFGFIQIPDSKDNIFLMPRASVEAIVATLNQGF